MDFDTLAEQYAPLVVKVIRSLHIYRDYDDYYQIALLALWQAQTKFDATKGSFTAFAYTTIRGHLLNELTKQHTIAKRTAPELHDHAVPYEDEYDIEFHAQLATLSPLQQRIVTLRCRDGWTFRAIADECAVTRDVVTYQYKLALRTLRAEYER